MRLQFFKRRAQKNCLVEFDPALIFESIFEKNSKDGFEYNSLLYRYIIVTKISAGFNSHYYFSCATIKAWKNDVLIEGSLQHLKSGYNVINLRHLGRIASMPKKINE